MSCLTELKDAHNSMPSCDTPSLTLINLSQMHRTQSHRIKVNYLKRRQEFMGSAKRLSYISRKAKRRLYCKLQLWMWRKRREKCCFGIFRTKRHVCRVRSGCGPSFSSKTQKSKRRCPTQRTLNHTTLAFGPLPGCDTEPSEMPSGQNSLPKPCESDSVSEAFIVSGHFSNHVTDTDVTAGANSQTVLTATVLSQRTEAFAHCCEIADASELCQSGTVSDTCSSLTQFKVSSAVIPPQRLEVNSPLREHSVTLSQVQALTTNTNEGSKKSNEADVSLAELTKDLYEFLDDFYRIYGSFIPLQKSDVLRHLKWRFNTDFSDRKNVIISEIIKHQTVIVQKPAPFFHVVYKKHTLTLDDLSTLADQNWLNDQVMNMYGELIMESANQEVHFLNSFFHRQLMTKGYEGVKRWTKQVDLFSKSLLLVPIHLEVHWCLVTADLVQKKICLYDSQGNALQKVARNILKYLITEAKEKQQTAFENGWTVSYDEKIPQQTNENDCGVFVLEYSRCLALSKPLQFSQKDIPKIRKRIYKELCDCRLHRGDDYVFIAASDSDMK